jgi:hypothetical protein
VKKQIEGISRLEMLVSHIFLPRTMRKPTVLRQLLLSHQVNEQLRTFLAIILAFEF